jgi:hypothetical protein
LNYDFKTVVSETHYYALSLAPYALGQNLMFHSGTEENTIPLFLSPYD